MPIVALLSVQLSALIPLVGVKACVGLVLGFLRSSFPDMGCFLVS
jgi:hypothetical protein